MLRCVPRHTKRARRYCFHALAVVRAQEEGNGDAEEEEEEEEPEAEDPPDPDEPHGGVGGAGGGAGAGGPGGKGGHAIAAMRHLVYLLHGMGCSWAVQLYSIARRIQEAHDITSYLKLVDKRLVHY